MRFNFLKILVSLFVLIPSLVLAAENEVKTVELTIHTLSEPSKVIGLAFSHNELLQVEPVNVKKVNASTIIAKFELNNKVTSSTNYAVAVATDDNGNRFYSDTVSITAADQQAPLSLQECKEQPLAYPATVDLGSLESLMENRIKQSHQISSRIETILTPEFAKYLQKLEGAMGLDFGKALSSDLPPYELADRLDRLATALESYKTAKGQLRP